MTDPLEGEKKLKLMADSIRVAIERFKTDCRRTVDGEYKLAKDALRAVLDTSRKQWVDRMATVSAAISAGASNNDYFVERLRHDMLSPEAVMEEFERFLADYPQKTCGSNALSVDLDKEIIEIEPDTDDEDDNDTGGGVETESVIQDAGEDDGQDVEADGGQDADEGDGQDAEADGGQDAADGSGQNTDTDTGGSVATRRATQASRQRTTR
jgi:hypothetical protein